MEENVVKVKRCAKCGRELPVENFYKSRRASDGLQSYCKECHASTSTEYQRACRKKEKEATEHTTLLKVYGNPKLAEFTPRELMVELKARGFRWEYMIEPQRRIMYDKLK